MGSIGGGSIGGAGGATASLTRFNGRPGPALEPEAGDYTAEMVTADGPLGAEQAQEALDLLAAAGLHYTVEQTASFVLGSPPSYTTLKTFTISTGTTRHLDAKIYLAGGTAAAPTEATITVSANARRTSGGTVSVPSIAPTIVQLGIGGIAVNWTVSGTDVLLQLRATGGPTVRAVLLYNWLQVLPP
jgi:hypothetical protein